MCRYILSRCYILVQTSMYCTVDIPSPTVFHTTFYMKYKPRYVWWKIISKQIFSMGGDHGTWCLYSSSNFKPDIWRDLGRLETSSSATDVPTVRSLEDVTKYTYFRHCHWQPELQQKLALILEHTQDVGLYCKINLTLHFFSSRNQLLYPVSE